jgi:hypothetical protein
MLSPFCERLIGTTNPSMFTSLWFYLPHKCLAVKEFSTTPTPLAARSYPTKTYQYEICRSKFMTLISHDTYYSIIVKELYIRILVNHQTYLT